MSAHGLADVRLHVVTGKGGTGKTTVAASLAMALATGAHRRVLLIEVEGRQGLAQLFDTAPLPYREQKVASAPGGGEVFALAVDPEQALMEYLELFYNLKRAGGALKRLGAIDFATTIAPGLRDVLLIGKVKEAVVRADMRREGGKAYDAVVLDAPPTGRITRFLNVTHHVAGLARVGPIRTQSEGVMAVLRSAQTAVHIVTLLEEMPVQETVDGVADIRSIGLPVGAVIVNATRRPLLDDADLSRAAAGTLDLEGVARTLKEVGVEPSEALLNGLAEEAREHAERVGLEAREREEIAELGLPTYELPLLPEIDVAALLQLAEQLRNAGMVAR
ncbi:MAG TPA: ArsA-related P-loop ATPase [Mycobacteriales bacterium]|nr:ArsA-related P-loop ATPase [Mycobacteriales bacterium]